MPVQQPVARATAGSFGDGSDGNVTVTGGTTTLARDMFYNNLTVTGTGILATNGFRVFVAGTLTVQTGGVIQANGAAAVTNSGGGAGATGTLSSGTAGGSGTPTAGTNQTDPALGGGGGSGGAGVGAAAAGGTIPALTATWSRINDVRALIDGPRGPASVSTWHGGAGGGGGGTGTGSLAGGGGGAGGGVMVLVASVISNSGTISANGGAGAAGPNSNSGGGGGGGGGLMLVLTTQAIAGNAPTANGGAFGAGNGTGSNGVAGTAGTVLTRIAAGA